MFNTGDLGDLEACTPGEQVRHGRTDTEGIPDMWNLKKSNTEAEQTSGCQGLRGGGSREVGSRVQTSATRRMRPEGLTSSMVAVVRNTAVEPEFAGK